MSKPTTKTAPVPAASEPATQPEVRASTEPPLQPFDALNEIMQLINELLPDKPAIRKNLVKAINPQVRELVLALERAGYKPPQA